MSRDIMTITNENTGEVVHLRPGDSCTIINTASKLPQVLEADINIYKQGRTNICSLTVRLVGGDHDGKLLSQSEAYLPEEGFSTYHLAHLLKKMAAQLEDVR